MPDVTALSLNGARILALANQARMAASVISLFKAGFVPNPSTTKAEFEAHECDYDGYTAQTIATWNAPVLAGQGWATYAPTQTFRWTLETEAVGNQVGGYWIETATGELIDYAVFDPTLPMQGPGQAVIKTPIQVTPAG